MHDMLKILFPNLYIVDAICLSIPVVTASVEEVFLK